MDFIQLAWPQSLGETLAWLTALATTLAGIAIMVMPGFFMRLTGLVASHASGTSEVRAVMGGLFAGLGLACLLLAPQPLLYFALGLAFAGIVVGRVVSFVADRAVGPFTLAATLVEAVGATFPLLYVFGIVA